MYYCLYFYFVHPFCGKEVFKLQQETTSLSLCFATVYQSAIRPYMSKNQRETVNTLFLGKGKGTLTDASCSNYTNGKRAVPDDYRSRLANISEKDLEDLLSEIGIHECDRMAETLVRLIEICAIPKTQRNRLLGLSKKPNTIGFIKAVFRAAADDKDAHPLDAIATGKLKALAVKTKAADTIATPDLTIPSLEPDEEFEPEPPELPFCAWFERETITPALAVNILEMLYLTSVRREILS